MADETEELRTEGTAGGDEDSEGGPVKTFLEHLEDLRWVLIKSLATLGVTLLVCLLAANVVVKVMMYPLSKAKAVYSKEVQIVTFNLDTNLLGVFKFNLKDRGAFPISTNRFVHLRLEPVPSGTNEDFWLLGVRAETNAAILAAANTLKIAIINLSPAGSFLVAFHVAMYAGVILAAPFILYWVAAFVFPALKMKERKYVYRGLFWSVGLFMTGVAFCYFILMPVALTASVQFSEWLGFSSPQWRAEDYIGFVSKFMLGMGLGFEMPVVILVLVKIGVLNYRILSKARRYVIVINFILGAMLTTPEVITQLLMAIPLQILYEITVWITWYWERKEKKRQALEEKEQPVD
ncbi:MAG: twin-arginine translocase subunit TatC [Verrucomicrobia bacterium]|nr:twin-arginine translocase subunit TatC [Verrucomicrobiota bacterium]